MLVNDTSLLTEETRKKLITTGVRHINTGGKPLTEEMALELIELFATEEMQKLFNEKDVK